MRTLLLLLLIAGGLPSASDAQLRTTPVASGFDRPLGMVPVPGRTGTFVVFEQTGRVRVLVNGATRAADFIDLRADIASGGEQGLLGLAFAPDFTQNGRVFLSFTNRSGDSVIARFTTAPGDPLTAVPSSRFDLQWPDGRRSIEQPFTNHNGGQVTFGPDGFLYVGMGDGGSGNDPDHRAQNPQSLLGKMLRLDVSVADNHPRGYVVPSSNPFVGRSDVLHEIWALGLRNPWRWSFDAPARGGSGAMLIGDVGQNAREEVDHIPAGAGGRNFGWRNREGTLPNVTSRPVFSEPLRDPIWEYGRDAGRSITGGYVYRGQALGATYRGRYFFGDFVTSRVWSVALVSTGSGEVRAEGLIDHTAELGAGASSPGSFAEDSNGELYILGYGGTIYRIDGPGDPVGSPAPPAPNPVRPHTGPPTGAAQPRP
jgi:glucose/arabinose dehydrogenase